MATSKAKEYVLPHHAAESKRLNLQHEGFVSSAGYLLHPRIFASLAKRQDVRVADVATGTAAWLLDLESEVGSSFSSWSFIGLDLSADQFPSTKSTQCQFDTLDIRQAIPARYQSYFDVVHIRMLLGGLTTPDWVLVAKHALQLLKPGGWLQWHEIDVTSICPYPSVPGPVDTTGSRKLLHHTIKGFNKWGKFMGEDMALLAERVEQAGLADVEIYSPSSDRVPEMRAQISLAMMEAVASAYKYLAKTDPECGASVEEAEQIAQKSRTELEAGKLYWRWDMYILTAQKPLDE